MKTKDKIPEVALSLFAEKGYENTHMQDIASAIGIKAPSLYKHFESKQAIFDAILEKMQSLYEEKSKLLSLDGGNAAVDAKTFASCTEDGLVKMTVSLFSYFLHDVTTQQFRKMMTAEQFRNENFAELYTSQYADGPIAYQKEMFAFLTGMGMLAGNPDTMALQFYAPIYFLLTLCDRQPEREEACMQKLENHIRTFHRLYSKGVQEK